MVVYIVLMGNPRFSLCLLVEFAHLSFSAYLNLYVAYYIFGEMTVKAIAVTGQARSLIFHITSFICFFNHFITNLLNSPTVFKFLTHENS